MKQITNIILLTLVLSVPFALSQTRKAIPAGRYEALSGVKISHSPKSSDSSLAKETLGLFWSEVAKHIPQGRNENSFFGIGSIDANFKTFLSSKGVLEAKNLDSRVNILLSDSLTRDSDIFKKIKTKGSLIILKDKHGLKDVLSSLNRFEVVVYQSETDNNYYLMKLK
ncbi:MAG: hypothetical protein WC635_15825 [Bacteriovorax sp.]|jgi:hypothetical protein